MIVYVNEVRSEGRLLAATVTAGGDPLDVFSTVEEALSFVESRSDLVLGGVQPPLPESVQNDQDEPDDGLSSFQRRVLGGLG
jgi:hypothetical protein